MKLSILLLIVKFYQANCDYYDYAGLNSECKLLDGTKGNCIHIKNCPSALQGLNFRETPKTCWFEGFEPVVCCKKASPIGCHYEDATTTQRINEKNPDRIGTSNFIQANQADGGNQNQTGLINSSGDASETTTISSSTDDLFAIPDDILNPPPPRLIIPQELPNPKTSREQRIYECWEHHRFYRDPEGQFLVGGSDSLAYEFPHMAALGYGSEDEPVWACGGSLISYRYVLTAAHCVNTRELGQVKFIRLGDLNLQSTTDDAQPVNFTVKRVIVHPDYKPPRQYNDIALLELNASISRWRNDFVNPTCLHDEHEINTTVLYATGWGKLSYGGENSDHLQKAAFREFKFEECREFYQPTRRLVDGISDETQICAGEEGKDTCQGDSGGPLQINTTEYYRGFKLVGITSFGQPCGLTNSPGVYTRVSSYIEWIESIVWPPKN